MSLFRGDHVTKYDDAYNHKLYNENARLNDQVTPITSALQDITMQGDPRSGNKISAVLVVDSLDRNYDKYPNSNKYRIKLTKPYKDITEIELLHADFPSTTYTTNAYNNSFRYQETQAQVDAGTYTEFTITEGNWPVNDDGTYNSIRSLLEDKLNENTEGNTYSVSVNENTLKFTIKQLGGGTGIFNMLFFGGTEPYGPQGTIQDVHGNNISSGDSRSLYNPNSIAPVLGFLRKDYAGDVTYTSEQAYNIRRDKYLILRILNWDRLDSPNDATQGSFAIISLDQNTFRYKFVKTFEGLNNEMYTKYFNPRLGVLNELDIEIVDSMGRPFLFNGGDHVLEFKVTSTSHQNRIE